MSCFYPHPSSRSVLEESRLHQIYVLACICAAEPSTDDLSMSAAFQALKLRAGDKHCLVARSKCYLKLGDTENSLKDAEASLQNDKTFCKVNGMKCQESGVAKDWSFICETLKGLGDRTV